MQDSALVVKDNRLIEASYRLTEAEQRIMLMAIAWARMHVKDELTTETWIELRSQDYVELFDTDPKNAYRQLKQAIKSLASRKLIMEVVDPITQLPATLEADWVTNALYVEGAGLVRINFGSLIIPYIWKLERRFTAYQLRSIKQLTGGYTVRLYELLLQYLSIGKRMFGLDDLRDILDAQSSAYDRINNFRARVLDFAVEQINTLTDLDVSYEVVKTGRRVTGIAFLIRPQHLPALQVVGSAQAPVIPTLLSIAERHMLRQLVLLTGQTEQALLKHAQQQGDDLFLIFNQMLMQYRSNPHHSSHLKPNAT